MKDGMPKLKEFPKELGGADKPTTEQKRDRPDESK
jgi:hypothetical protein